MTKTALAFVFVASLANQIVCAAEKEMSTFKAYVDSDLCARLMLGPITSAHVGVRPKASKEGSESVLVRLSNDMVLGVNKNKMIKHLVGQLIDVSGELKVNDSEVKLQRVTPIEPSSIPPGDPARKLLDVRTYRGPVLQRHSRKSAMSSP